MRMFNAKHPIASLARNAIDDEGQRMKDKRENWKRAPRNEECFKGINNV